MKPGQWSIEAEREAPIVYRWDAHDGSYQIVSPTGNSSAKWIKRFYDRDGNPKHIHAYPTLEKATDYNMPGARPDQVLPWRVVERATQGLKPVVAFPHASVSEYHRIGKPRRLMVKCACGYCAAFTAENGNVRINGGPLTNAYVTAEQAIPLCNGVATCGCGRPLRIHAVKGTKTSEKCGPKCVNTKGHDCECSCGGSNHGRGYELQ